MTLQRELIDWFEANQRDLPWRTHYTPYQVWVSEVMLQQTQVKTMLPYFERWMQALPDVKALAEAEEDQVLKLWEGLGYYSRARNLQKAARQIMDRHGGLFPLEYDEVRALPGVGPYTAGAIMSIAYGADHPVVDGNVVRVLARLDAFEENTRTQMKHFWARAEELLPAGEARAFNQGLMELGALICTPKNPKCESCPVQSHCLARERGLTDELPYRGPSTPKEELNVAIAVIRKGDKVFIQKRLTNGLMPGLWEFPGGKIEAGERAQDAVQREIKEETGLELGNVEPFMEIKHAYTRFKVNLHCFLADYERGQVSLSAASEGRWVPLDELDQYPFPAANVRLIKKLRPGGADGSRTRIF